MALFFAFKGALLDDVEDVSFLALPNDYFGLFECSQSGLGDEFEEAVMVEVFEEDAFFEVEQQLDFRLLGPSCVLTSVCLVEHQVE